MGNACCGAGGQVGPAAKQIFLLMVGLDNAGKTCTAKSIVGESLECVAPTVGFSKVQHKYKVSNILYVFSFSSFNRRWSSMLQGYQVTIYDLGGSKSFRGIWPKYYHEVHGFIFVVDSSDAERLGECSAVLRTMLDHSMVRGKPILLLANKADAETAQDEVEVVSQLDIEALVNTAQCPTRVEASVATRNQGLREGYKWLVKSVIADYLELGGRVARDVEQEQQAERERRAEVRRRLEERREREEPGKFMNFYEFLFNLICEFIFGITETETSAVSDAPPGFIPVAELRARLETRPESTSLPSGTGPALLEAAALELEPLGGPRKRGLLARLSKPELKGEPGKPGGERTGPASGYRNWGLAEELEPSPA